MTCLRYDRAVTQPTAEGVCCTRCTSQRVQQKRACEQAKTLNVYTLHRCGGRVVDPAFLGVGGRRGRGNMLRPPAGCGA